MSANYSYQGSMEHAAKAFGRRLRISTKHSIEVCKAIKGHHVERAQSMLESAVNEEEPIEFTRYSEGAGHKAGQGMGKYPVKAGKEILKVLNGAVANAQHQGLSSDLEVVHAAAQKAQQNQKRGRHAGRTEKGTHIEIVVKEVPGATRPEPEEETDDTEDEGESAQKTEHVAVPEDAMPDESDVESDTETQERTDDTAEPGTADESDETPAETEQEADAPDTAEESTTVPDDSWTVPEIKEYLDEHDIDYTSNDLKADLLEKAQEETE